MFSADYLEEPLLIFGGSNPAPDPKLGLSLYGPYSWNKNLINIGVIGSKVTTEQTLELLKILKNPVKGDPKYPRWRPDFPGFNKFSIFKTELNDDPKWTHVISQKDIDRITNFSNENEIIANSVDLFISKIKVITEREEVPDLVICAPPDEIIKACVSVSDKGPQFKYRFKRSVSQQSLLDYMPDYRDTIIGVLSRKSASNFHHRLKAMSMAYAMPTQMIKPSTLEAFTDPEKGGIQHKSVVSWNLGVGLLYKAGARLWRIKNLHFGTCFIGISFYKEKAIYGSLIGTSLVHIFTPEGDGLVLKGERFDWPSRGSPHLSKNDAETIIEKSLKLYKTHTKTNPRRVVIHKSSIFWDEEKEGFIKALANTPEYDLVSISPRRNIHFFREGYNPILRGTKIKLPENRYLIYTKGYTPYYEVYPGPRIPRPLEITQHIGDTPQNQICSEILALTKINWNTSDIAIYSPITLFFSTQVSAILKEIPPNVTPQTKYLYYM